MAMEYVFSYFGRAFFQLVQSYMPSRKNSIKSEEDHISELPDDVLALVLSHLTVKDCFKTRVLSRRWRHLKLSHLRASRSDLNFDYTFASPGLHFTSMSHECQKYSRAFVRGVNKFLDQYKGPNISSFAVGFCLSRKFSSDIDRWITCAVKLGVERLKISLRCIGLSNCKLHEFYSFSFRLLAEAYELQRLELDSCILKQDFSGQFHSLKFLELTRTPLGQSDLLYILSRFCNLEELSLLFCSSPSVLSFRAPFLKFKKLSLFHCDGLEEIELSATSLTSLNVASIEYDFNIVFSTVPPNLENIFLFKPCRFSFAADLYSKIENVAPQIQSLITGGDVRMVQTMPSSFAAFHNLKLIEFFLCTTRRSRYDIRKIIPLMVACPLLEIFKLSIRQAGHVEDTSILEIRTMTEIEDCCLPHLKRVELFGFNGTWTHLELALYLLRNAVALEWMLITPCEKLFGGGFENVWHETYPTERWTESIRGRILEQLQGKAASKSAQLSIRDTMLS